MNIELGHIPLPHRPAWCPDGWDMEDGRTAFRDFYCTEARQLTKRLKLTCNGHYLVDRSNSWMFDKPESALRCAEIIATEDGFGWKVAA